MKHTNPFLFINYTRRGADKMNTNNPVFNKDTERTLVKTQANDTVSASVTEPWCTARSCGNRILFRNEQADINHLN